MVVSDNGGVRDLVAALEDSLAKATAKVEGKPVSILCAHADQDGVGAHWKLEGEPCDAAEMGRGDPDEAAANDAYEFGPL